jgi:hypothetical protein
MMDRTALPWKWMAPALLLALLLSAAVIGCGIEEEYEPPWATTAPDPDAPVFAVVTNTIVYNGGKSPEWTITGPMLVSKIQTYHWNDKQGAPPGTIGLKSSDGTSYGPWEAQGLPGQFDVPNAYWVVTPNQVIPAGTYTVVDSDPATWAQNEDTWGRGCTWIWAKPAN